MGKTLQEIQDYLLETKSLVLATVDSDNKPQIRHLGGYNVAGLTIYFLTTAKTAKTKEILENPQVAVLFQKEGQQVPKNITIYGKAEKLTGREADERAEFIRERRPQLKYDSNINEIYKIQAETVKILDFCGDTKLEVLKAEELL